MRIIYLTTSLQDEDYNAWGLGTDNLPNPSNQNFHSRLIRALMTKDDVQVISLVPKTAKGTLFLDSNNYHYVNYPANLLLALQSQIKEIKTIGKELGKNQDSLIVFDSLNLKLCHSAHSLSKKLGCPSAAILTDNPKNISESPIFYQSLLLPQVKKAHGFLSLSDGLLEAFNVKNKPHFVFEGIVEESHAKTIPFAKGSFLYFAGALKEKYGIKDLIGAYFQARPDYDLVIAGHSNQDPYFAEIEENNVRVHFLGQVSKDENASFEENAALLINPRRFNETLDKESVPSKMLEFLMSGSPILSTPHTKLQEIFPDDVNWLQESGENALQKWFENHLDQKKKLMNIKPNNAKKRTLELYGLESLGSKLHCFLASLN
jgi:glycosyltransferase involved in cell wall biosynthesis